MACSATPSSTRKLKANQNFSDLQAQLEGTENRIAVARKDFNASVKAYNGKVRRFPGSLWAEHVRLRPAGLLRIRGRF